MILVTGDPVDPNALPERLQLFNELGEPLMLGGGFARREQEETTGLLTPGQIEASAVEFYPSVRLYRIVTNRPARVRLYPTEEMRDADLNRAIGIKPPQDQNTGRLLEVVTATGLLDLTLSPAVDITSVDAFNAEFFASVTNLDSVSGGVAVIYHYFRTE